MKIVYILGTSRTGSTMLDLIISSHPLCVSLGELCLFEKRKCGYCEDVCKLWVEYKKKHKKPYYYKTAFEVFGGSILVDSSKKWKWFKERVKYENYEYKVIHLVRNGKDRLKFRNKQDRIIKPYVIQDWVNTHKKCEKLRKEYGGILVKYEEIEQELPRICKFVGIDYQPQMIEFWKHEHHGLLGSKTAYSMVRKYHNKKYENTYVDEHGYNIAPRLGHEFLDEKDLKVFNKCVGRKLNKELGYE